MAETAAWKQPLHQVRRILAQLWLQLNPRVTIIGITGSFGKTNTTLAIATVLSQKYKTLQTDLNLDTIYNLPITLLKLRPWHQKLVLEYGVDHKGEMDFHLSLVKPSIAVVTGINPTHSDPELLGSLEGVIKEKSKLLTALPQDGLAILNLDDEKVRQMAKKTKARIIWYGTSSKSDFRADRIKIDFSGTSFTLHHQNKKYRFKTGLIGRHFVHECLAAVVVGRELGLSWPEIKKGLAKSRPLKGRVSIEKGPKGSILIDDSLRANPASTKAGLQVLADLPVGKAGLPARGKRIAVLGEMGELGDLAKEGHREVGKKVAGLKIDYLIGIGPLQRLTTQEAIKQGMKKEKVFWAKDVRQAAKLLEKILEKGDLFYLKGSLLRHMERVLLLLEGKEVGCEVTSCHFYSQCPSCPHLHSGPPEV
jgi:UDP-N-acetylmuramoyl-tripeptide--D-alanyl-D-alanine ligase